MRAKWVLIKMIIGIELSLALMRFLPDSVSIEKRTARHRSDASRYCNSFVYPEIMK